MSSFSPAGCTTVAPASCSPPVSSSVDSFSSPGSSLFPLRGGLYNQGMRKLALLPSLMLLLLLVSCWSSKQQMYATVVNQSGVTLNALEVAYPGGSYGIAQLKRSDSNRKWVAVTTPCTYSLHFEDEKGKQYQSKPIDFGKDKCPSEVVLTVDSSMNVSGAPK